MNQTSVHAPVVTHRSRSGIASVLETQLIETFENPAYRPPPLPAVAIDLMQVSSDPNANAHQVVQILERDPMLAGAVMRLVSSSLYAGRSPTRSLHEAVVRLGITAVRDAVFEASISMGTFEVDGYQEILEQVRRHSVVTAYLSRIVSHHSKTQAPNAFMCGLLHDIGFAALLFAVSHMERTPPPLDMFWGEVDSLHEEAARIIVQLWKLPEDISSVVGHHHQLHDGSCPITRATVAIADSLAGEFGAEVLGPLGPDQKPLASDASAELTLEHSRHTLELGHSEFERIREHAERAIPDILWL